MADDSNEEQRNQVYLTEREFSNLTFDYQRTYFRKDNPQSMLLYAKAYFLKEKYEQCIDVLHKIQKNFNTKVLFERQALLFKASYLKNPNDLNTLNRIIQEYETNKTRCPGKILTNFHNNQIKELMDVVLKGQEFEKRMGDINKLEVKDKIKLEEKKNKYEGMPSYLISINWNKKFNQFLLRNGPFPGPITNFQLVNHVFQLEPHYETGKSFMDKLIFPMVYQDKYYALSKKHWEVIYKLFSGIQVKRVFCTNSRNRKVTGGDNLIKTVINCRQQKYVMQWQSGTYWQRTILPSLRQKFGSGQLKQQKLNKQYVVLQPGRAEQPFNPLRYIPINIDIIPAETDLQKRRRQKIFLNYDLQKHNPDQIKNKGTLGLLNLGNTCYMSSALQFLSNLKIFSEYFITNKYIEKVNMTQKNKQGSFGQVLCSYADLVKRLWFNHPDIRYIDPTNFKRAFGERHSMFVGNQQEDAQQFLMFLLSCLHEDLNQNAQGALMHRESMGGKTFQNVRNISLNQYKKYNKSIISDLFHGFLFQEIMCDDCKFKTFRFQYFLMLHVQAPPQAPKLSVFVVQAKNYKQAKKVQVYTSKLQKVSNLLAVIRQYFTTDQKNKLLAFLYYDEQRLWQSIEEDKQVSYITRASSLKSAFLFIHEIKPPEPDQQIAMITYHYDSPTKIEVDGFPRFMSLKKVYKEEEYDQEIRNVIFDTIPQKKIERDRKDYIKEIKIKKMKGKQYEVNYRVVFKLQIKNFVNISIDRILGENVNTDGTDLESCLAKLSEQQVVDQYKCQKCNQVRSAHKTDKIYSTSKYLIIQTKRFTQNGKICTRVDYPIDSLNMRPFIYCQSPQISTLTKSQLQQPDQYKLQGVILHRGSLNSGHYTCICRNREKDGWLYYDDESVRDIDEVNVVDANAYILFYEKKGKEEDFMLNSTKYQKLGLKM